MLITREEARARLADLDALAEHIRAGAEARRLRRAANPAGPHQGLRRLVAATRRRIAGAFATCVPGW